MSALKGEIRALQTKCEDLDNRSRRNNLKMVGIAEGEEGKALTAFINILKDLFGLEDLSLIDRAHRLGQVKPNTGQPPRPFILRAFSMLKNRLSAWPERREISHTKEKAIHIFGDLTAVEAKRRAAFNDVRKTLQNNAGAQFGFRHPATFRITMPSREERHFTDPQKAMDFVMSASSKSPGPD